MIIGITKILILFPFIPYLIFLLTSKSRKMAHVYNGPIVVLSIVFISSYILDVIYVLVLLVVYILSVFYFATENTKKKRTPKRFGMNVLLFCSWLGLKLYVVLVIIGVALEMLK